LIVTGTIGGHFLFIGKGIQVQQKILNHPWILNILITLELGSSAPEKIEIFLDLTNVWLAEILVDRMAALILERRQTLLCLDFFF
jgi:hypothetical protein